MAYSEHLAARIRERFELLENVEEKAMMGGLVIMYNGKMCVGIMKDELMCRVDPVLVPELVGLPGCRSMKMNGRTMKSYILIDEEGMRNQVEFEKWIELAIAFNPFAKASKK